jgi:hypothetical protein
MVTWKCSISPLTRCPADVGDLEPVKASHRTCRALHSDADGVVNSLLRGPDDLGQSVHMTIHGARRIRFAVTLASPNHGSICRLVHRSARTIDLAKLRSSRLAAVDRQSHAGDERGVVRT